MRLVQETGWTLDYIGSLSMRQLNALVKGLNASTKDTADDSQKIDPTVEELQMFGLASGIQRRPKKKVE